MKNYTKTVVVAVVMFAISAVGFGVAFGYGGGSSSGGGGGCAYGIDTTTGRCNFTNRTYPVLPATANPKAVVATQKGRVLVASAFNFTKSLDYGMTSNDVTELQNLLAALGHFNYGKSTGYFGPITRAAVIAFKLAN
ncbi:MAG: peptidoglycan-binding domain-containing protein, partial [Candidatus Taylorbacteria bacterium]